jgi:predicted metalloprotease
LENCAVYRKEVLLLIMANWDQLETRGDVDDRRGSPMSGLSGGIGLGGIALVLLIGYIQTGTIDLNTVAQVLEDTQVQERTIDTSAFEGVDAYETFASTVLGSTNELWSEVFESANMRYVPPRFVLFRGGTESSCGGAYAQYGPHYCPTDQTVYIDETFFDELRDRFGATGDVAQAYVIAHEVGHHVQTLLDTKLDSISLELQADCFAGLWAHSIKDAGVLEKGEIIEALNAAAAVGDDNIQKKTTGRVNPETWTHGSSEDRVAAFNEGYTKGTVSACTQ